MMENMLLSCALLLLCVFPGQGLSVKNNVTNGSNFDYVNTTMYMAREPEDGFDDYITYENVDMELPYLANTSLERLAKEMQYKTPWPVELHYFGGVTNEKHKQIITIQQRACIFNSLCNVNGSGLDKSIHCCGDCSCDLNTCLVTGNCCPDILYSTYGDMWPKPQTPQHCVSMYIGKSTSFMSGVYAVDNCPDETDKALERKCIREYKRPDINDFYDITPCYDIHSNITYRNQHCAQCNGVDESDVVHFKISFECSKMLENDFGNNKAILDAIFAEGQCHVSFANPLACSDGRCDSSYNCWTSVTSCNTTGNWQEYDPDIETACLAYSSVYISKSYSSEQDRFRNIFCYICNGFEAPRIHSSCISHGHPSESHTFSFSGLLKMSADNTKYNTHRTFEKDTLEDKLFCASTRQLEDGQCQPFVKILVNVRLVVDVRLTPVKALNTSAIWPLLNQLNRDVVTVARQLLGCVAAMTTEVVVNHGDVQSVLYELVLHFNLLNIDSKFRFIMAMFSDRKFRVPDQEFNVYEFTANLEDKLGFIENSTNLPGLPMMVAPDDDNSSTTYLFFVPSNIHDFCLFDKPSPFIYYMHLIDCPLISVSKAEYGWTILKNKQIRMSKSVSLKTEEFYYLPKESIAVCKVPFEAYIQAISKPNKLSPETILSVVCIGLSLLCLCLSVSTYMMLPKLRKNIPGKNTISLICSLLVAQTLYLVGNLSGLGPNDWSCKILGLFIHYTWLWSMFWMNICTFHMFRVLTRTKLMGDSARWKRFLLYHVYALVLPLVFVAINIGVSQDRNRSIGYGSLACYIDTQDMIIFTFALPVGLIVVINLLFFLVVIVKLSRSPSVQKNVQNERNDFKIFVKLSTITGITWVFGLIYMLADVVAFSYLFIVLSASQGVFLFFAFVANRRVAAMLREKLCSSSTDGTITQSIAVSKDAYLK